MKWKVSDSSSQLTWPDKAQAVNCAGACGDAARLGNGQEPHGVEEAASIVLRS